MTMSNPDKPYTACPLMQAFLNEKGRVNVDIPKPHIMDVINDYLNLRIVKVLKNKGKVRSFLIERVPIDSNNEFKKQIESPYRSERYIYDKEVDKKNNSLN